MIERLVATVRSAKTLKEISVHFGGVVPGFFKALAEADSSLLEAKWAGYKLTLFSGSMLLPQRLKSMMLYQVVKAHSQCPLASKSINS